MMMTWGHFFSSLFLYGSIYCLIVLLTRSQPPQKRLESLSLRLLLFTAGILIVLIDVALDHRYSASTLPEILAGAGFFLFFGRLMGRLYRASVSAHLHEIKNHLNQTEMLLTQAQEKFQIFFDETPDLLIVHGFNGQILEVNQSTSKILGYPKSELLKKYFPELEARETLPFLETLPSTLRMTGVASFESVLCKFNGDRLPVDIHSKVLQYNGIPAILSIVRDARTRKLLEVQLKDMNGALETKIAQRTLALQTANAQLSSQYQLQNTLRSVLEIAIYPIPFKAQLDLILGLILSIPKLSFAGKGAIYLIDNDGFLTMNAARGMNASVLSTCARVKIGECLCGECAKKGEIIFSNHLDSVHSIRYHGISDHGHYCIPIISETRVLGVLNLYLKAGHVRDFQETEFFLAIANTLAEIFERQKLEQDKEQFLHNISHELRTPLTSIIGYQELLGSGSLGSLTDQQQEALQTALQNSHHLESLIHDLLDLTQLETGQINLKCDLKIPNSQTLSS